MEDFRRLARLEMERGGTLKDDLGFNTSFARYYESLRGHAPAADSDPVDLYAELLAAEDDRGAGVPSAVSVSPDAIGVATGPYSKANPVWPIPMGGTNDSIMYSPALVSHRSLWKRPDSLHQQLERAGRAETAQVHFFLEFGPGDKRACLINLVWSESHGEWMVESTSVGAPSPLPNEAVRWAY
jgi:hypothetical protein